MPAARSAKSAASKPSAPGVGPASQSATSTRVEKDTMGEMIVPADVLYGASTQRAVLNFPVSGRPVPFAIISAYADLKAACAAVNLKLGRLNAPRAKAIAAACTTIKAGLGDHGGWAKHFPVDVFQTGSGTSTNMNANEVIANLVCLAHGAPIGSSKNADYLGGKSGKGVHPNDHVNMGQSSNDTFPTAIHIAAVLALANDFLPALAVMKGTLNKQAKAWDKIVKIGRTHLQDATPIRLGQEFSGFASQIAHAEQRVRLAMKTLGELAIGGTAVGTGIATHERFDAEVCMHLSKTLKQEFRVCENHFEAQHAKDACVEASGHLKTIATSLTKIAGDIRLMGMGPRCGIGELVIPAVQPGSSIMPGKVNPVIAEALIMVCGQVIGNDAAITYGNLGALNSTLDLNVAMPLIADNLLESISLMAAAVRMFNDNLLVNLKPDEARCKGLIEGSLAMCTSLMPIIGYDNAAALAKQAFKEGKTVRELAYQTVVGTKDASGRNVTREMIDSALDPWSMTLPGGEGAAGG